MPEIPIKEALNKAFVKVRPERAAIETFKTNFIRLLDTIKANPAETEEFLKNLVSDFLKKTWYGESYFINTKGRMDMVIHNGKDTKTPVGVIIEAKKPGNKHEMITRNNLNAKAMHELLLYYFQETVDKKEFELKHLIITNIIEWFIFDAQEFYRLFSQNKELVDLYTNFNNRSLRYIFEFLDAYDFSSEGSEEIQEENKTLISASVLGLIFEKINGYRDGSYFTPGFIFSVKTDNFCHQSLMRAL
jgi:hypothetical protein